MNQIHEDEETRPSQDKLMVSETETLPSQYVVKDQDTIETEFSHVTISTSQSEMGNMKQPGTAEQGEEYKEHLMYSETEKQRKAHDKSFKQAEIAELGQACKEEEIEPKKTDFRLECKEVLKQSETTRQREACKEDLKHLKAARHEKTCKELSKLKTTEERQACKDDLKQPNTTELGKAFQLPQSINELIACLNFYRDSIDTSSVTAQDLIGLSSGLYSPDKLLQEIILKLRGRGDFAEEDFKTLLCKVPFHDTKSQ